MEFVLISNIREDSLGREYLESQVIEYSFIQKISTECMPVAGTVLGTGYPQ